MENVKKADVVKLPLKMNLQLFGEGDPEPAADPISGPTPEPQNPSSEPVSSEPSANTPEPAEPVQEKPVQDPETNARFADVRRRAETEARDNIIKEVYGDQGITTYEQYQEAVARQNAINEGKDPEVYALQQRLDTMERNSVLTQQEKILADQPYFKEWQNEIKAEADANGVDYETVYTVKLAKEMPNILKKFDEEKKTLADNAVKDYLAKKSQPQGVVESGDGATPVIETKAPKTFAEARANAMAILKQSQGGS